MHIHVHVQGMLPLPEPLLRPPERGGPPGNGPGVEVERVTVGPRQIIHILQIGPRLVVHPQLLPRRLRHLLPNDPGVDPVIRVLRQDALDPLRGREVRIPVGPLLKVHEKTEILTRDRQRGLPGLITGPHLLPHDQPVQQHHGRPLDRDGENHPRLGIEEPLRAAAAE